MLPKSPSKSKHSSRPHGPWGKGDGGLLGVARPAHSDSVLSSRTLSFQPWRERDGSLVGAARLTRQGSH